MSETSTAELLFRPVTELAGLVHSGELSARELVEASLRRIEEVNPQLNAFVDVDADGALAAADKIGPGDERPFAGVPIAIKNNRAVAGWRLTSGCPLMKDFVPDYDNAVVSKLKDAGFVLVGSTTLPEYGILPVSEASLFGPTRNPWDLERTPGGSTGGGGAAVASGMVPIAHGTDGGGSLRIPAACCGLVGLKAQRGRISTAPELGDSELVIDGVLTRTVGETAALLDLISGYVTGDATWAPPPERSYAEAAAEPPGRLRIAVAKDAPIPDGAVDALDLGAVDEAAELLAGLGHEVEEVTPPWRDAGLQDLFGAVFCVQISLGIMYSALVGGRDGEPREEDMEPMSWAIWSLSKGLNSVDLAMARARLQAFSRALVEFLDPYDAFLTPALAERPLPIGTLDTAAPDPMSTFTRSGYFTPFTAIFNATGQPAISLPLYHGTDGLPLAVQLASRPADEGTLLALSAQLEAERPWADRRPEL